MYQLNWSFRAKDSLIKTRRALKTRGTEKSRLGDEYFQITENQ